MAFGLSHPFRSPRRQERSCPGSVTRARAEERSVPLHVARVRGGVVRVDGGCPRGQAGPDSLDGFPAVRDALTARVLSGTFDAMTETVTMTPPMAAAACRGACKQAERAAVLLEVSETLSDGARIETLLNALRALDDGRALGDGARRSIVDALREQGLTWQRIGELLGISRQSAWERYGKGSHRGRG